MNHPRSPRRPAGILPATLVAVACFSARLPAAASPSEAPPAHAAQAAKGSGASSSHAAGPRPRRRDVVIKVNGVPCTYRDYLRAVRDGRRSWELLLAMPGGDAYPKFATEQEWIFQHDWAEPQLMRAQFQEQDAAHARRAQECWAQARAGKTSWDELVNTCSNAQGVGLTDGDLGLVDFQTLPYPFNREMFTAQIGEIPPPVLTAPGYSFGRVLEIVAPHDGQPEKRHVQRLLVAWDPVEGLTDAPMANIGVMIETMGPGLHIDILNRTLCSELPHFCAQNDKDEAAALAHLKLDPETPQDSPAPSEHPPSAPPAGSP